mmetsp:Transcript_1959/g.4283  ORF Transcript_1959/g.4283 Transcript_1959/m.4283 type:complete len:219 (+) Transcript_1959:1721-2377(+)
MGATERRPHSTAGRPLRPALPRRRPSSRTDRGATPRRSAGTTPERGPTPSSRWGARLTHTTTDGTAARAPAARAYPARAATAPRPVKTPPPPGLRRITRRSPSSFETRATKRGPTRWTRAMPGAAPVTRTRSLGPSRCRTRRAARECRTWPGGRRPLAQRPRSKSPTSSASCQGEEWPGMSPSFDRRRSLPRAAASAVRSRSNATRRTSLRRWRRSDR